MPAPNGTGWLSISFVNHAGVAAKDVTFVVRYAGATRTIDDRGTFSHNVLIDHGFAGAGDAFSTAPAACSVASATFADGSTWRAQS